MSEPTTVAKPLPESGNPRTPRAEHFRWHTTLVSLTLHPVILRIG